MQKKNGEALKLEDMEDLLDSCKYGYIVEKMGEVQSRFW